jgi:hypothetical protein
LIDCRTINLDVPIDLDVILFVLTLFLFYFIIIKHIIDLISSMPLYRLLPTPSPIDRLPVELLSYIFSLRTQCSQDSDIDDSLTIPLLFTSVNKRWRSIALSTSALWTNICITIRDLNGPLLHTNHITKYLTLSRKSPLNILIDARDPDWDFSETEYVSDTHLHRISTNQNLF